MISKEGKRILGIGALFVVFFLFWCVWSASDEYHQTHDYTRYHYSADKTPDRIDTPDDLTAKYTLWLAILTGCLVCASIFQGYFLIRADRAAKEASETATKTAKAVSAQVTHMEGHVAEAKRAADAMGNMAKAMNASALAAQQSAQAAISGNNNALVSSMTLNRAYLYFRLVRNNCRSFVAGNSKSVEFSWDIVNFGKTPGRIVSMSGGVILSVDAPQEIPPTPSPTFGKAVLAEGEATEPRASWLRDLTDDDRRAIAQGETTIWFGGGARYVDVFGITRELAWCYAYDIKGHELSSDRVPPGYIKNT